MNPTKEKTHILHEDNKNKYPEGKIPPIKGYNIKMQINMKGTWTKNASEEVFCFKTTA